MTLVGSTLPRPTRASVLLFVALVAAASYLNALGNRWAADDEHIVQANPVVTDGRWGEALTVPYWAGIEAAPALWRPVALELFTAEWSAFGDRPAGFHALSLALHALVSVLVCALLFALLPPAAAGLGGLVFAIHPVHVEAVANVVGQSELVAAAAYLGACLVYLAARRAGNRPWAVLSTPTIAALYALALGAKESAVTLPGALLLLGVLVPPSDTGTDADDGRAPRTTPGPLRALAACLREDAPLLTALTAVLGAYLVVRVWVLGSVTGENVTSPLLGMGTGARVLTALSLWPTWIRLLVAPLDLSSDYGPGVLLPATSLRADVILGGLILAGLLAALVRAARSQPWAALAAGWLVLTLLPVSNLFFPVGTMLAERTLYLPSVAAALAAGGALALLARVRPAALPLAWVVACAACGLLLVRTVTRNPTWMDSLTFMRTLAREHPESVTVYRGRATALVRAGDIAGALHEYDAALALMPNDYSVLTEAGALDKRERRFAEAERLLATAVRVAPDRPVAYRLLSELYLLEGDGRRAHAVALAGLAHWGTDHDLWALVSESYVAKGDLAAAIRAREAALAQDPGRASDRTRLAELMEAQSHTAAPESMTNVPAPKP